MTTLRKTKTIKHTIIQKDLNGLFFWFKKDNLFKIFKTILFITILLIIWELIVTKFNIPKRIIPKPTDLFNFLQQEFSNSKSTSVLTKSLFSFKDALIGFILSLLVGTGIGITLSKNKIIDAILFPFLFLTQVVPVPALAPVVAAILGYGQTTKIFLIVLFTIFPIAIIIKNAILNIPENYILLLHTYTRKRFIIFKHLILPSLVPPLLSVMKIVATSSIVATIITELPLSVKNGIGKDIYNSFNNQLIPRVWVSVIIISIISLLFFNCISFFEKYITTKYKYGQY